MERGREKQRTRGAEASKIHRVCNQAPVRLGYRQDTQEELGAPSSELPWVARAQEASGEVQATTGTRYEDTPTHKHARNKDRPEPHACWVEAQSAHAHPPGRKEAAQSYQERGLRCGA